MKVLLGISGGADSVAMLRLLYDLWTRSSGNDQSNLVVAHYNHNLRGEQSNADQAFVCELANTLGLTSHTQTAVIEQGSRAANGGEAAFRSARYRYLQTTAEKIGARCVLVAHTADDNVETMLHHLFRGTGARGLAGIAPHRSLSDDLVLLRPMLAMRRDELRMGLREINQAWREDASNTDERFQRNWIRGKLLPTIRERFPRADEAILRAIDNQSQIREQIHSDAKAWIDRCATRNGDQFVLQRGSIELATLSAVVRLLWDQIKWPRQSMTTKHLRRLHATITGRSDGAFTLPGDVQCQVIQQRITLKRERLVTATF